jgi:exopolysaccharide production protein ExoZ
LHHGAGAIIAPDKIILYFQIDSQTDSLFFCRLVRCISLPASALIPKFSPGNMHRKESTTIVSVQYLRALAAVLVLLHHAALKQGQISGSGAAFSFGMSGVDLFFIISGFIMCHVTSQRETSARLFLWARVKRIIPLYWTLSLVALAVYVVSPNMVNTSGGVTTILNSFTLIPNGDKFLIQNGWTLSYEFWFYLLFAAVLSMPRTLQFGCVFLALVGLATIGFVFAPTPPTLKFITGPLLLEFAMGIAAHVYIRRSRHYFAIDLSFIVAGVAMLVTSLNASSVENRVLSYDLPYALVFAGLVSLESLIARGRQTAGARVLEKIGEASYSIYLSHPFVLSALGMVARKMGVQHSAPIAIAITIMVMGSLVVGYGCYVFVEKNLARGIQLLIGDRSVTPVSLSR